MAKIPNYSAGSAININEHEDNQPHNQDFVIPEKLDYEFYIKWLNLDSYNTAKSLKIALGYHPDKNFYGNKISQQSKLIFKKIADLGLIEETNIPIEKTCINPLRMLETAFQYEIHFPDKLLKAYEEITGKPLTFQEYSPIKQFYKKWGIHDLWTLEQAICVIYGMSPELEHRYSETTSKEPLFPFYSKTFDDATRLANTSIKAEILEYHSWSSNSYNFKPIDCIKWAISKDIQPHQLLLEYTGYDKRASANKNNSSGNNASNFITKDKILESLPCLQKERTHLLNPLIANIFIDLAMQDKKLPSAIECFDELEKRFNNKNIEITEVISEITKDVIKWYASSKSSIRETKKSSIDKNLISSLRTEITAYFLTLIAS